MGAPPYWRRPRRQECLPRYMLSNCSEVASISPRASVKMPASKLRQLLLIMPIPASVRLAERYGLSRSRRLMHPLRARLYNLAAVEIFAESGTGSLAWIRCIFIHSLRRYHWLACLK